MGAAAEFVENTVSSVGDFVGDAFEVVGDIALDVVQAVGDAVVWVGEQVGEIAQAAINDPVGTMLKVAAIASGQWWALPLVSAGLVIANGGDIGQAALAAGISLAAQGAASWAGEALSAGSSAALDMATADVANLAAEGFTASQIAQIAAQSYPEIGASAISRMAEMAAMGIPAAQIATEVGSKMALQNIGAATAGNALGAGTRTALTGGDVGDILTSAGSAGLGTAVGGGTSMGLKEAGVGSTVAGAIGKGAGAATASGVAGKDGAGAFLNSLINTTLSEAGAQTKSFLKDAWGKVTASVDEYNKQLETTNATQAKLDPLYKEAKDAEAAVNAELAAYKPVRDKFSDLVTQYDEAKAAGDVALANSLAAQANALIPELNAATEKYNGVYNTYENKANTYATALEGYKSEIAKTDELKAGYEKTSEQLTAETKRLSDAADKVVKMPEPVQQAFSKMYQNGTDVDTALENSNQLSKMSTVAQETFNRDIAQSNNTESAFEFANKINSLDTKQQTAFQTGITTGLDNTTALEVAPIISSYDVNQQKAYTNAVKQGYGSEGADLISAFSSFAPEQTTQQPVTQEPAKLDVAREFSKLDLQEQEKFKELVNDPTRPMTAADAFKAVSDFFISPAGAGTLPYVGKTPDGKDLVESVYRQDPTTNKWGEFIPDGKGGYTNTGTLLAGDYSSGPTGKKYVLDKNADENGVPALSMMPYTGPVKGTASLTPAEEAELAEELKASAAKDDAALKVLDNKVTTTPSTPSTPFTPSIPNFGTGTADFTAPPKATGTGGTSAGTATNTPGAAGTTGATGGSGTGAPVVGGAGAGPVVAGGGTGTGTGTGTGGTGTGTGGGGTGTGFGFGMGAGTAGYSGWQALQGQDQYGGIKNLTPGLTQRSDYTLSGLPTDSNEDTVNPMMNIDKLATGGSTTNTYDPFSTKDISGSGISGSLVPGLTKAQIGYILSGLPGNNVAVPGRAEGGSIPGHSPEFYSEGGLSSMENRYVEGEGDGTSDSVPAMLANGEFVIPADVVSKLGNGSNEAGAGVLDQFLSEIRKHAHSNGEKLPPDSKGPLGYLLDAKRKVKA
jgi:hypothetical protein